MRHECDTCGYSWLDNVPSSRCVVDRCGVCRRKVGHDVAGAHVVVGAVCGPEEREEVVAVARQRIASGHYDRIEVIDATVDRIMDDLDRA